MVYTGKKATNILWKGKIVIYHHKLSLIVLAGHHLFLNQTWKSADKSIPTWYPPDSDLRNTGWNVFFGGTHPFKLTKITSKHTLPDYIIKQEHLQTNQQTKGTGNIDPYVTHGSKTLQWNGTHFMTDELASFSSLLTSSHTYSSRVHLYVCSKAFIHYESSLKYHFINGATLSM